VSGPVPDTSVELRVLGGDDWRAWRDVRLRALQDSPGAFGATYAHEVEFGREQWRSRLEDPDAVSVLGSRGAAAVAMGGGFQDLPGFLHVVAMWVEPASRGRGLGHQVLDVIRRWADSRALRLHLDVHTANAGARRSYERYGFVATGECRPLREGSAEQVERLVLATGRHPV
jgi:GNAT superfamily N-acetyltransferase